MDFNWDDEQKKLYERTYKFAQAQLNRSIDVQQQNNTFPYDEWAKCGEFGLLGLSAPKQYGGMNLSTLSTANAEEAFGYGCEDGGLLFSVAAHLCAVVMPVAEFGSDLLKKAYLPGLCSGDLIGANAMTETEAGSDILCIKTQATREGDFYVLNGIKSYVSNGPLANLFTTYAKTNPDHGYMGISAFIVDKEFPGVTTEKAFKTMGLKASQIGKVHFENCRIPIQNRIGAEGQGNVIFSRSMQWERVCLFATYLGMLQRQLEKTIQHASTRKQFRKPIGNNQAVSHKIVNMKLRLESARLLLYRACWLMDNQKDAILEVSLAKLAVSEAAIQSSLDAIQIHGGLGFMEEGGVEQNLRDSIPSAIFSGTSEIHRDLIANQLGL